MCEICNQNPCHPRCPNAPEPKVVKICFLCGEFIQEGDEYFEIEGESYCCDCITKTFPDDDTYKTICSLCEEEIDYNSKCYFDGTNIYCPDCVKEKIAGDDYF